MIRLGYQIPNFTYPGVPPEQLFETVAVQAVIAEESGFDTAMVMDHFYQLPMLGDPEQEMLECYSTLAALAAVTDEIKLSALVTGNTYRNPALLGKTVTTLDHISGGRAILGIGTGWFELEHQAMGIEFGTFGERFEKLEEALQILGPMLKGEPATFHGSHYQVTNMVNSPPPLQAGGIPIMIGGSGEKKTLRMVAQYAQESNLTCGPDEISHKLEVLEGHLADHGRKRSDVNVTWLRSVVIDQTREKAIDAANRFLGPRGIDLRQADKESMEFLGQIMTLGSPDEVAEDLAAQLAKGLDGLTINLPANGHDPEIVALAGETLSQVVSS